MPDRFGRPIESSSALSSFVKEASRLRAFVPPFRFSAFFSPEDTLLCACASEAALARARTDRSNGWSRQTMHIAELTTGSGLVGLHLLMLENGSQLIGMDVDPHATDTAQRNAKVLGLTRRARFECADLWSDRTLARLREDRPAMIICNPPYIPEPPGEQLDLEAGAGPAGTSHLERTIDIADDVRPRAIALSWCSLSDPGRILRQAESAGYWLRSLFCVVIADGEYSGAVHEYLRALDRCYITENEETVQAVAPDGSGRFAYMLMAGDFSSSAKPLTRSGETPEAIERICEQFAVNGLKALENPVAPIPVRAWILDRWDELRLRAFLHGTPTDAGITA